MYGEGESLEVVEAKAQRLARIIDHETPEGWGFVLIHFSFGEGPKSRATYVSNCDRQDVIKGLREMADSIEEKREI